MDFSWSKEQSGRYERLLDEVRDVCARTHGEEPAGGRRRHWRSLAELGVLGSCVPVGYGGQGLGALDTARSFEALGRGCPHTGLVFGAAAHLFACAMPIAEFGSPDLRAELLPKLCAGEAVAGNAMTEPEAGSDVSVLAARARRVAGGWVLTGEKSFVSNGPVADVFLTYVTTRPEAGYFGQTAFVVDRTAPGVHVGTPLAKLGLDDCLAAAVRFEDCFVPDGRVLGDPGQGGPIFQHSMGWERACLFAGYLGLADRVLEQVTEHVRARRQSGEPISRFQAVSHRVADMALRTESARLLLYRACWLIDQGERAVLATALSKLAVSEGVLHSALDAVRLFGARGYLRGDGIEAALRDAVPSVIFSGTSDIQRQLIARELGL
ncbi:acyl-CoA dehydrogenase family protein [Sphaerisporangium sp. TRM90804]|uniref:acyl-CoA dehydrogenase family protein n=1 Tax=Sphaerisporangium sp. TRM90804 TaxID=3031113 RepID=UPI00244B954D|nr:acyl-CoA dehydrogenase family protein [Sphaerisporangium sp. TRM90804]MDH2427306.1 acyl-CoA dehydrogenase family protein [Sphaerisporangium sp. TRM90804]